MGITKDDGHKKSSLNKVYDYLKIGTDVAGNIFWGLFVCGKGYTQEFLYKYKIDRRK